MTKADLDAFLSAPVDQVDLAGLAHHWRRTTLHVTCARPKGLEDGPWLAGAVRGAWGRRLRAIKETAPDTDAGLAADVFFSTFGQNEQGIHLPKPFVIAADTTADTIEIELTLFGVADCWRETAFEALLAALDGGMAVRPEANAIYVPWKVRRANWTRAETLKHPQSPQFTRMTFLTPVKLGARHTAGQHVPDIIVSLAKRIYGLAFWQGLAMNLDWQICRHLAETLTYSECLHVEKWVRHSGAQGGRAIEMVGIKGHVDFVDPPDMVRRLMAFGETTHAGGGAALGLGRFMVS